MNRTDGHMKYEEWNLPMARRTGTVQRMKESMRMDMKNDSDSEARYTSSGRMQVCSSAICRQSAIITPNTCTCTPPVCTQQYIWSVEISDEDPLNTVTVRSYGPMCL